MPEETTILVVDDEPRIVQFVTMNLELEGFRALSASNGYEALDLLSAGEQPALIVLDVMMPGLDGFETLKRIREKSATPIIFVSVKGEETDRVTGLDLGADDYLTKPFSPRELVSRIRAVLRRMESPALTATRSQQVRVDDQLTIDFDQRKILVRGQAVKLRPTEYRLLHQLVSNHGRLMTHEKLLHEVWGPEYRDEHHYLRLYITYLRQKLEKDPRHPEYILSERGLGYRFKQIT